MQNTIIVNNVSASTGGAQAILNQFLDELKDNQLAKKYKWIIFVSNNLFNKYNSSHIKIIKVNVKQWHKRILWDVYFIRKWLKNHKIKPIFAISLMSVGIKFLKIKQLVYIHQSLPFSSDYIFKWFEIKYRIFIWLIFIWMKWSINSKSLIVVQTDWMKKRVHKKLNIQNNQIFIFRPNVYWGDILTKGNTKNKQQKFSYKLFYPVVPTVSYKNFELLIKTFAKIKEENAELSKKIKLIITCTEKENNNLIKYYYNLARTLGVYQNIEWIGYCNKKQIYDLYLESDALVFPSKLESFGLPLIEAASFGKKIFAINKPYVKNVLGDYQGLERIENNSEFWSSSISKFYAGEKESYRKINLYNEGWSRFINLVVHNISD
jgi:hypothetical protein